MDVKNERLKIIERMKRERLVYETIASAKDGLKKTRTACISESF